MSIRGKIAQILDETRVVLNIGATQGVKLNQCFMIYQEGDEIFDPESKISLGKIEIPKGKIIIESVQEKMAIGVTELKSKTSENNKKTLSEMMVEASTPKTIDREKLIVDRFQISPLPTITPVKVGDWVRLISE